MYPQVYVGQIPATAARRQALRALALELRALIHTSRSQEPITLLLHFSAGEGAAESIDLLLLSPHALIVGAVRSYRGAIDTPPGGRWIARDTGEQLREARDRTPIQHVRLQRDAVRARLDSHATQLLDVPQSYAFERTIGALIVAPTTHPDSRISLDVNDHRAQLKVLGLDELPGLAAMVHTGVQLSQEAVGVIAHELFGGRLWHDGARFLFDMVPARFRLRVLATAARAADERKSAEKLLTLLEGENVIGRRRAPQKYEHRLVLSGDELISADHALLTCGDGDYVMLRDTSKNGTWFTPPDGVEERVRGERAILPGTVLRMGMTRLRLERTDTSSEL